MNEARVYLMIEIKKTFAYLSSIQVEENKVKRIQNLTFPKKVTKCNFARVRDTFEW